MYTYTDVKNLPESIKNIWTDIEKVPNIQEVFMYIPNRLILLNKKHAFNNKIISFKIELAKNTKTLIYLPCLVIMIPNE